MPSIWRRLCLRTKRKRIFPIALPGWWKTAFQPVSSTSDGIWDVLCHVEKNDLADRKSYELYEEELPESEVRDEFSDSRDGYFVYNRHKDIKNVHVTLSRKPYYFGPEPVIAVVIDDMGINHAARRISAV